jgi:MoaA/NifB/PqqE/SkfB family radical SAM enzyme
VRSRLYRHLRFVAGLARGRFLDCEVVLGYRCNLECRFCAFWRKPVPPGAPLPASAYRRISDELAREGSLVVSLEGGEPLLRSDTEEIVEAFARRHIPVLYTNGLLVDRERARRLFAAGLEQVAVSLDYATPARHDANRNLIGTHDRAVAALAILAEAAPRGGRQVHAFTVVMEDNVAELEALLDLTRRLGVGHQVSLLSTSGWGRSSGTQRLPPPGIGGEIARLRNRHAHLATFPSYLEEMDRWLDRRCAGVGGGGRGRPPCRAGLQGLAIDPAGLVAPCLERLDSTVGSLLDEGWPAIRARLMARAGSSTCELCCTLCRGFTSALGSHVPLARRGARLAEFVHRSGRRSA